MRACQLGIAAILSLTVTHLSANAQVRVESTPPAWQAILAANGTDGKAPAKRQYSVTCKQVNRSGKLFQVAEKKDSFSPTIIVHEEQTGKIESLSQTPFVTGVQKVGTTGNGIDAYQPLITVLQEGHSIELKVTYLDGQHVQIDARFEFLSIEPVETVAVGERTTQAPINNSVARRLVRTVRLDEQFQLEIPACGDQKAQRFECRVKQVHSPQPDARALTKS